MEDVLKCFVEYFGALLNSTNFTKISAIEQLLHYPIATEMNEPITETELVKAINFLKSGKAAGPDDLPPDLFRHGEATLLELLQSSVCRYDNKERQFLPSDCKETL